MSNRGELSADKSQELELARRISSEAHHGQTDKTGEPYVNHCQRIADRVDGAEEKTVAFLHDIVEKCDGWDFDRLRQLGFGDDILDAVDALTQRQDETDDQFVVRAVENKIACPVKIADLQDNLHQANVMGSDPVKYKRGLELVTMMRTDPNLTGLT